MRAMANQRVYFEVRSFSDFSSRLFTSVFSISNLFSKIRSISNTHSDQIFPFGSLESSKESVILTDRHSFIRKENQKINNKSEIYEECDSCCKIQLCGYYYSAFLSFSNFSKKSLRAIGFASAFRLFQTTSFSSGVKAFAKGFSGLFLWVDSLFEIMAIQTYKFRAKITICSSRFLFLLHPLLSLEGFLSYYFQISLQSAEFFWSYYRDRLNEKTPVLSTRQSLEIYSSDFDKPSESLLEKSGLDNHLCCVTAPKSQGLFAYKFLKPRGSNPLGIPIIGAIVTRTFYNCYYFSIPMR